MKAICNVYAATKRNKMLIGTIATVSFGVVSLLLWNKPKDSANTTHDDSNFDLHEAQNEKEQQVKIPDRCDFISRVDLKNILKEDSNSDYLLIDVREIDYSGGHIAHSVNISDKIFYDQIYEIIKKSNHKSKIAMYCMYGARRSVKCAEFYVKAITEVIAHYDKETKSSHYFIYEAKQANNSSGGWMDENVVKKRVDIDFCDDELIENLSTQKIMILEGGYFQFLNYVIDENDTNNSIQDFEKDEYEQLELQGVFDQKMWYHKKEYFAKQKCQELQEARKYANFKLSASTRNLRKLQ